MSGYPTRGALKTVSIPEDAVFLPKPFKPADLARALRRALDGPSLSDPFHKEAAA
jgi:hypothetical protein